MLGKAHCIWGLFPPPPGYVRTYSHSPPPLVIMQGNVTPPPPRYTRLARPCQIISCMSTEIIAANFNFIESSVSKLASYLEYVS